MLPPEVPRRGEVAEAPEPRQSLEPPKPEVWTEGRAWWALEMVCVSLSLSLSLSPFGLIFGSSGTNGIVIFFPSLEMF